MIVFPNCKINLGLNITGKRGDGFHDLETVFYPVYKLHDVLEILPLDVSGMGNYRGFSAMDFQMSGLPVDGDANNNLCVKAYQLLKQDFPELPAVQIHLHKVIPMGAGLGGGSADGAFALTLLNDKFQLNLKAQQLIEYALQLGSDCPFFIINKPCFAWSRGEKMQELKLDLKGHSIVLINPGIHINTGWAFGQITPQQPITSLQLLIQQPIESWKELVKNDFEAALINAHPLIGSIKSKLYERGAVYAAMSGSGSTVYGIFSTGKMPVNSFFPGLLELHMEL